MPCDAEWIPPEILIKILDYLDIQDIVTTSQVCRRWHQVVHSTECLWKSLCLDLHECQRNVAVDRANGHSWRETFMLNYGKNGLVRKWKQGAFSNIATFDALTTCTMAELTVDTWAEIFQAELDRPSIL